MQIVVPSASGDHDNYVGLSYAEGIGKVCFFYICDEVKVLIACTV